METIRELFSKPIDRRIEEVIKVDQDDEATVAAELDEYVVTDSILEHFRTVFKALAEAPSQPHEGIGIWVSGFFGSGKSSFAKYVGYAVANRDVQGRHAGQILAEKVHDEVLTAALGVVHARTPTHAIIFDVSMDRGVRAGERITELMYKALLRELGYAEDFDLAELEVGLEADELLGDFRREFQTLHGKPWDERRKLGRGINEASAVLNRLQPATYPSADSWAKTLGQGRADITPNLLAERAFELARRRKPGEALLFVIDEVGQFVSRSVDKMLDLQAVVQAFGREGKNRVQRHQAVGPCWIVVTSQEKLNEVVEALDSRKIELARLQDRFPLPVDLKQSDISEVTGRRVLEKSDAARDLLGRRYDEHEGRLNQLCKLEATARGASMRRKEFVDLYPYLPYQIDLCIDIVSGLRLRRGAQRHIGGSNRTIIKQAQQMLVHQRTRLADRPIGALVTLDLVYELLYAGNLLPSEVTREVDDVASRLPANEMALRVTKAITLLEVVADLPRTPHNLAVALHPRIDADSLLPQVHATLKELVEAQIVRDSEEGYKLLTLQEKNWDATRGALDVKPADRRRIRRELLQEIFSDPAIKGYRYQSRKAFALGLAIEGETGDAVGDVPLQLVPAEDRDEFAPRAEEARRLSNERPNEVFWVCPLSEEIHRAVDELHRSREMISLHERQASQGRLPGEEASCLANEKVRRDRIQRALRARLAEAVASGAAFFRGVRKDASALGDTLSEMFAALRDEVVPLLYPKFELGNRRLAGDEAEKLLTAANLNGLPAVFHDGENGLNLILQQGGKAVANLNAEVCREVLDYLRREHAYGNKVTGKSLDAHFHGLGYAWDREVLQLVLAVLLRGGAIEVTYQGHKHRNHNDPACREPFTNNQAFRAASFAPREALDLKMLADAARNYEAITGQEVDIEEGALAVAYQKLAADDRELLLPLVAEVRAAQLPGTSWLAEFQQTVDGVLEMPTDDCVRTLAGEGKSYHELRQRAQQLAAALTAENLRLLRSARRVVEVQAPAVRRAEVSDEVDQANIELTALLASDRFYERLDRIARTAYVIATAYRKLYTTLHDDRRRVYAEALDGVKGLPEWLQVTARFTEADGRRQALLAPLEVKACERLDLGDESDFCRHCRATPAQMESDIAAVGELTARVVRELQALAVPEKRIVRVRVASLLSNVVEDADDVEVAVDRLREHLLKLLAEDTRIVLE